MTRRIRGNAPASATRNLRTTNEPRGSWRSRRHRSAWRQSNRREGRRSAAAGLTQRARDGRPNAVRAEVVLLNPAASSRLRAASRREAIQGANTPLPDPNPVSPPKARVGLGPPSRPSKPGRGSGPRQNQGGARAPPSKSPPSKPAVKTTRVPGPLRPTTPL